VVIMEVVGHLLKSDKVGFISLHYFMMLTLSVLLVSIANVQVPYLTVV